MDATAIALALTAIGMLGGAIVFVSKALIADLPDRVQRLESSSSDTRSMVAGHEALFAATLGEVRGELRGMRDDLSRVREDVATLKARP